MNWVAALQPGDKERCNSCLVMVDRYRKTLILLPCHKDDTAMDTALLIWNRVISHTGISKNIISDREPRFKYALCRNLYKLLGTKLSFSTAYHPQTDGVAERMLWTLEDIIRIFCFYVLDFKDSDGFTHDWCTLILELELAYKTSMHASTEKTFAMMEKGDNPKLPVQNFKKYLGNIHPNASILKLLIDKSSHHANQIITEAFEYTKKKWDKSHRTPEFKVGELILVSNSSFHYIKGPKKWKDSFEGQFTMKAPHGTNAVKVELSGILEK
ncbi:hypothetical protein O181_057547 [Austropuccinia psidii MF-1]|uniref:Integrase catalytic domain-containing protein n=1 Tax=Austropuccinia psidii MF-1 TaxID=1389203 RepID=A0A9Q3EI02_9BASI|nr:hypothetical protein [Austropuccinia psidii MF-1]